METLIIAAGPAVAVSVATLALAGVAVQRRSRVLSAAALISTTAALPAAGLGYSVALSLAFSRVAAADPSLKASLLAEEISVAMRGMALSAGAALLAGAVSLAGLVFCYSRPRVIPRQEGS